MLTYSVNSISKSAPKQKMETHISSGDAELYTILYPKDDAETVILLHGGPGVPDNLEFVAASLSEQYQVIIFHQRGTGKSPVRKHDYSIPGYLNDIRAVASYFHLKRFHLFGHSWGGLLAQIFAQEHPDRIISLFLCSPSSGTGYQWKETEAEVMAFNRRASSRSEWLRMGINSLLGMLGSSMAYRRVFDQVIINYNRGYAWNGTDSFHLLNIKAKPVNRTRKEILKYPTLLSQPAPPYSITVTYGDGDIYGESTKYVTGRYPTARIMVIRGSGHLPAYHQPEQFRKILHEHFFIPL